MYQRVIIPPSFEQVQGSPPPGMTDIETEHSAAAKDSSPPVLHHDSSSVNFASQTALDIIVECKGTEAKRKMAELLASCAGNTLTAA